MTTQPNTHESTTPAPAELLTTYWPTGAVTAEHIAVAIETAARLIEHAKNAIPQTDLPATAGPGIGESLVHLTLWFQDVTDRLTTWANGVAEDLECAEHWVRAQAAAEAASTFNTVNDWLHDIHLALMDAQHHLVDATE